MPHRGGLLATLVLLLLASLALVEAFGPRPRPRLYSKVRREISRKFF